MKTLCSICKRELDIDSDLLSSNCGGDCWGCIGEIEARMGDEEVIEILRQEFRSGLRPNWMITPEVKTTQQSSGTEVQVKLWAPLGEPLENEPFILVILIKSGDIEKEVAVHNLKTGKNGVSRQTLDLPHDQTNIWFSIERHRSKWGFPIDQTK